MKKNTVNLTAIIFACVLLVISCFWAEDVWYYQKEILKEREALADEVYQHVMDKEFIDAEAIEESAERIEEKLQVLMDGTDLGEMMAKNDQTTEGRSSNQLIALGVLASIVISGGVILWNVILFLKNAICFFRHFPENAENLRRNWDDKFNKAKGAGHKLSAKLKETGKPGRFQKDN